MHVVVSDSDDIFWGPFEYKIQADLYGETNYGKFYGVIELTPAPPQPIIGVLKPVGVWGVYNHDELISIYGDELLALRAANIEQRVAIFIEFGSSLA